MLVVLPQDGAALTPVAQKAEKAGIPVVNIDRLFTAPDAATATVLGDNYQIGVLAANYIADELKCKGNVVEIQGLAGISVTTDRTKGFTDTLKKKCPDGGIKIVASQPGDFNPDKGLTVMENILQAQSEIDAVYTHDDDMAQGVVQAIRNAGRDDEMFLTGVGGSEDAMKQIKEGGLYRATFLYNPNMAGTAVNMARLIGLGEGFSELVPPEVPRQVIVPAAVVTKDNVERLQAVRVQLVVTSHRGPPDATSSGGPRRLDESDPVTPHVRRLARWSRPCSLRTPPSVMGASRHSTVSAWRCSPASSSGSWDRTAPGSRRSSRSPAA